MNEFPVVLVINCGSSSIKFSVLNASDCEVLMSGIADGINSENAFLSVNGGEPAPLAHHSYEGALKAIAFELEKRNLNDSVALITTASLTAAVFLPSPPLLPMKSLIISVAFLHWHPCIITPI